jgi:altronate dehydratase large subunit
VKIKGFDHGARGVGIRDIQLILPSVICSTHVSKKIADAVGAKSFAHNTGCAIIGNDVPGIADFFDELAAHPNVSSVLVVGLGCETIQGNELTDKLLAKNPSAKYLVIQESGGMGATLQKGSTAAKELQSKYPSKAAELNSLLIGIEASENEAGANEIKSILASAGINTVLANGTQSSNNFAELMKAGVHLIISLTASEQPPTGYPLIPVVNIASNSPLHSAITSDFDLASINKDSLLKFIEDVANGTLTKAEQLNLGEIFAPRVVRSV